MDALRSALEEYLQAAPGSLGPHFRFSDERFQGSVGMLRFIAFAKRKLARDIPSLPYGCSLEEAAALIQGTPLQPSPANRAQAAFPEPAEGARNPRASAAGSADGVGIDMEAIASMPEASDYRVHDFYREVFTPEEIAYCVLQPDPRRSFCGLFCAKESYLKVAGIAASLKPGDIEIGHDPSGKPYYKRAGGLRSPPCDLSISHAGDYAVAAAVIAAGNPARPGIAAGLESPISPHPDAALPKPVPAPSTPAVRTQSAWNLALASGLIVSLSLGAYLLLFR